MTKNKMTLKAEVLLYIQEHFSNQAFLQNQFTWISK